MKCSTISSDLLTQKSALKLLTNPKVETPFTIKLNSGNEGHEEDEEDDEENCLDEPFVDEFYDDIVTFMTGVINKSPNFNPRFIRLINELQITEFNQSIHCLERPDVSIDLQQIPKELLTKLCIRF